MCIFIDVDVTNNVTVCCTLNISVHSINFQYCAFLSIVKCSVYSNVVVGVSASTKYSLNFRCNYIPAAGWVTE